MSEKTQTTLSHERACDILYTYGADASQWPDAERDALQVRLKEDDALSQLLFEMTQLDDMLDDLPVEPPSFALQTRILSSRIEQRTASPWRSLLSVLWPYGSAAVPAGALLASAIMGGVVGVMANAGINSTSEMNEYQVVALALGESFTQEESP